MFCEKKKVTESQICQTWWVFDDIYLAFSERIRNYPSSMGRRIIIMQNLWFSFPKFWPFAMYNIVQTIENEQVVFLIKCLPSNRYSKRIIPRKTKKNVDKTLTFERIWLEFFGFGPFSKRYLDDCQLSSKSYLCILLFVYPLIIRFMKVGSLFASEMRSLITVFRWYL